MSARGRLIAFEGGEGCGKSTQAARLARRLDAVCTHEPGATPLGADLRTLMLDRLDLGVDPRAEALLMAADRAQHVAEVIEPALASGRDVVTDRYVGSSLAYQSYGRGLPFADVAALSSFATGGLDADIVILLVVPAAEVDRRRGRPRDRLERAGAEFHERVAAGFRALADADDRWKVVDGSGSVDAVEALVWDAVVASGRMAP